MTTTPCYIRWGDIPEGERSRRWDRKSRNRHKGTSAYEAHYDSDLRKWRINDSRIPFLGRETLYLLRHNEDARPILLLTGRVVDMGPDGEPLLRGITALQTLKPEDVFVPHLDDPVEVARYQEFLAMRSMR